MHLNWIRLATNPSWLDSSIGRAAVQNPLETTNFSLLSEEVDVKCIECSGYLCILVNNSSHNTAMIKFLLFSRVDIFILVLAPVQISARYYNELKQ